MKRSILTILITVICGSAFLNGITYSGQITPKFSYLILPLTEAGNLNSDSYIDYYYQQYKTAADSIDGKILVSFKAQFKLGENYRNTELSLFAGPGGNPYNIYLNGIRIFTKGRYDDKTGVNTNLFTAEAVYFSSDLLKYDGTNNELVIEMVSIYERTPLNDLHIDSKDNVIRDAFFRNLFNVHFVQAAFVVAFMLFIYFLFLFGARNFQDGSYLYFALFCLSYMFAYINMVFQFDSNNEVILEKISRIFLPVCTTILAVFVIEYTEILNKNRIFKAILFILTAIGGILVAIQPDKENISRVFSLSMNFIMTPCLVFSIVLLFISVIKKKKKSSLIILMGFAIVIFTSIHDINSINNAIIPYCYMVSYGYLALILSIFLLLAYEESNLFKESALQRLEIARKNESLNKIIGSIRAVTTGLSESCQHLNEIIADSKGVIIDYGNSNKLLIDKIVAKFGNIDKTMQNIALRIEKTNNTLPPAIQNQTTAVQQINATITDVNKHLDQTTSISNEAADISSNLSLIASESTAIVKKSNESIKKVADSSRVISVVFDAVSEIAEKTNLLAINASIEAARAGRYGEGFIVVANEIRKLSLEAKRNLSTSSDSISQILKLIDESSKMSDIVEIQLKKIIETAGSSNDKIKQTLSLINIQRTKQNEMTASVKSLLSDTLTIKDLTEKDKQENNNMQVILADLNANLVEISDQLKNQSNKGFSLVDNLTEIERQQKNNVDSVKKLSEELSI